MRHSRSREAVEFMRRLFDCRSGHSSLLEQTLLIGSGGSHGVDALGAFSRDLQEACGKRPDLDILGDGIRKPLVWGIKRFETASRFTLNLYQRSGLLRGRPIYNALNVHVGMFSHALANTIDDVVVDEILMNLAYDQSRHSFRLSANLTARPQAIQAALEEKSLSELLAFLQTENDGLWQSGLIVELAKRHIPIAYILGVLLERKRLPFLRSYVKELIMPRLSPADRRNLIESLPQLFRSDEGKSWARALMFENDDFSVEGSEFAGHRAIQRKGSL